MTAKKKGNTPAHDYSDFLPTPGGNILAQITHTATEQMAAELKVAEAEAALTVAQGELKQIQERELPELMDAAMQDRVSTQNGLEVKLGETIRANLPKATLPVGVRWLEDNEHEQLVKEEIKFQVDRYSDDQQSLIMMRQLLLLLEALPVVDGMTRKVSVNPSSLSAFCREQLGQGVDLPQNLLGIFRQVKTTVKPK
jgi:hypothetical protein